MDPLHSLKAVRAIAEAAVRDLPGDFTIAAVLPGEARGPYAEVLIVGGHREAEQKRLIIGIDRHSTEFAIRETLAAKLLN